MNKEPTVKAMEAKEIEARKLLEHYLESAHSMYSLLNYMGWGTPEDKTECTSIYWARWRQHDLLIDNKNKSMEMSEDIQGSDK